MFYFPLGGKNKLCVFENRLNHQIMNFNTTGNQISMPLYYSNPFYLSCDCYHLVINSNFRKLLEKYIKSSVSISILYIIKISINIYFSFIKKLVGIFCKFSWTLNIIVTKGSVLGLDSLLWWLYPLWHQPDFLFLKVLTQVS